MVDGEPPQGAGLVLREIADAIPLLAATPTVGKLYQRAADATFRRLLLRRSRFHVYYVVDESARVVVIAAVWNGVRGLGPPLT